MYLNLYTYIRFKHITKCISKKLKDVSFHVCRGKICADTIDDEEHFRNRRIRIGGVLRGVNLR